MAFEEILEKYIQLRDCLKEKREALIKRDVDKLGSIDENILALCNYMDKFQQEIKEDKFSPEEKESLKKVSAEVKELNNNNEILIKHSLNVMNNLLSGIVNIATQDKNSYNSQGVGCVSDESLNISSITEEA